MDKMTELQLLGYEIKLRPEIKKIGRVLLYFLPLPSARFPWREECLWEVLLEKTSTVPRAFTKPPRWWISTGFLPDGAYVHSCFLPQLPLFPSKCTFSPEEADPAWGLAPSVYSGSNFSSAAELHFPGDLQIGQVLTGCAGVWCLVPQLALLHEPH